MSYFTRRRRTYGRYKRRTRYRRRTFKKRRAFRRRSYRPNYGLPSRRRIRSANRIFTNKRIIRARTRLALPPPIKKGYSLFSVPYSTQYETFSGTNWSAFQPLDNLTIGSASTQRVGDKVKMLPCHAILYLSQAPDNQRHYRIMVVKMFDMQLVSSFYPNTILQWTNDPIEATYSSYKNIKQEQTNPPRFKVLFDKSFIFNSFSPRNAIKQFILKIPGRNVEYLRDSATVNTVKNGIFICITTDGLPESQNYSFGLKITQHFLDSSDSVV